MVAPVLSKPDNGTTLLEMRPEFKWGAVSGAVSYTLQVSLNNTMTSPVINATVSSLTYTPTSDLPRGKQLYWWVKANGANPSGWSQKWSLTSANPPGTPVLLEPFVNALTTKHKPWFDWKDSTLPPGTIFEGYHLQIATDSDFGHLILNEYIENGLSGSEFQTINALNPNTLYYWRVNACNVLDQCSAWSSTFYFRTALPEPVLIAPANGASLTTQRPVFDWGDVSGAANYTLLVSTNSSMSSPLINVIVISSTYTPISDLPKGQTLYWRVMANGANPSGWSDPIWSFSIH
jgi:hypothetical protein